MSNVLLLPKECEHGMPFLTGRPVRFLSVYLLNQCVSPPGRRPVRHLTGPFQVRQETATNASKNDTSKLRSGGLGGLLWQLGIAALTSLTRFARFMIPFDFMGLGSL